MNARAYDYSTVRTTYTLTDPTDKQGKLVRVVGNHHQFSDTATQVKSTGIPGIWYNDSALRGQNEVKSGELLAFRVDDVTLLWHWLEEVKGEEENGW